MNEVLRQENKNLMNMVDMWLLSGHLRRMMISDHHNVALGRQIRALYFDTLNVRGTTRISWTGWSCGENFGLGCMIRRRILPCWR